MHIDVWKPKLVMPESEFPSLSGRFSNLRNNGGVEAIFIHGCNTLVTDGLCDWHDDVNIDSQYSLLYVVRNDCGSYVQSRGTKTIKDQPVGTMILLDIWHKHRLWNRLENNCPRSCWMAVAIDIDKKPRSRKQCEQMMFDKMSH